MSNAAIVLVINCPPVPSFKNRKRAIFRKNQLGLITEPSVKERMLALENGILSALYSDSQIIGNETHLECWKRLRTVLLELYDDSVREIPNGSWETLQVTKSLEGVTIEITEINT